jgi:cyclic pyranopterin phosphate synthase
MSAPAARLASPPGPKGQADRPLVDRQGRVADTLRLSLTDRCNLRCTYCMPADQRFAPRDALLAPDEIAAIADAFIARGVRRIRLSGGEPLYRRDFGAILARLAVPMAAGRIDELLLTTNGMALAKHAKALRDAGVARVNVSLDSLDPHRFAQITRGGDVAAVLGGLDAAAAAGLSVRLNMVAMAGVNGGDLLLLARFAAAHGFDLALIEAMPLGEGTAGDAAAHVPLDRFVQPLRDAGEALVPIAHRTSGPARYVRVEPLGLRLGLITPLSHNFCEACTRLRVSAEGQLMPCLGAAAAVDLRGALRGGGAAALDAAIDAGLRLKPARHDFEAQAAGAAPRLARHMNRTGG